MLITHIYQVYHGQRSLEEEKKAVLEEKPRNEENPQVHSHADI